LTPTADPGAGRVVPAAEHGARTAGDLSGWTDGLLVGVALAYAAFIGVLTLVRGIPITPDVMVLAVALAAVILVRNRLTWLRAWVPFAVLLLAYELMRGLADDVGLPVHVGDVAALERGLFAGRLPTALLQGWLHPTTGTDWLAVIGTVIYYFHFALPILTAILLWRHRPQLFHPYVVALILLCFAGFVTYLLLPVAPPWLAAQLGQIGMTATEPMVTDLKLHAFSSVVGVFGIDGEKVYDVAFLALSANPVAAFPSLHAAFAFLSFLVLRRAFGPIGWVAFGYFAAVAFTIVYSGDHYVVDVLAGVAYASAAYGLMWFLARRVAAPEGRLVVPLPG
jgi:membrane-associated phospholipid phosphatase